jgi:hypothetical protein
MHPQPSQHQKSPNHNPTEPKKPSKHKKQPNPQPTPTPPKQPTTTQKHKPQIYTTKKT